MTRLLRITLNGRGREDAIPDSMLLVDYLRDRAGLKGTKVGCDGGECGACTVLVDGKAQPSCITLAASCDGAVVETIESLAEGSRLSALQRAFHEKLGTQCGFCTPGMIMSAEALLRETPKPGEDEVREALVRQPVPMYRLREDHRGGGSGRGGGPMSDRTSAGRRLPLVDGIEKVTGRAAYTADLHADALVERILRNVDISEALALDGVRAIVTGADCAHTYGVLPITMNEYPMARNKVRYRGEPIAAVVAVDEETAQRALDLIELDIEELPGLYHTEAAMAPDAVLIHDDRPGNIDREFHHEFGDTAAALEAAGMARRRGRPYRCARPAAARTDGRHHSPARGAGHRERGHCPSRPRARLSLSRTRRARLGSGTHARRE